MTYLNCMLRNRFAIAPRIFALSTLVSAAVLSLATMSPALAQEQVQGWVPAELELPADSEVLTDRSIGSSLRMFSFRTDEDVDTLLNQWEVALQSAGYTIIQGEGDLLERAIEFSGQGISNAKIAVAPASADDSKVIEIDATLQ